MARWVKCQWCGEKENRDLMTVVEEKTSVAGRVQRKYCHPSCVEKYYKDKERKEKEKKQREDLFKVIKRVHNINIIPHQFYSLLEQLRKGTPYVVIRRTYILYQDEVRRAKQYKKFDSTMNELKYCFFIMRDKFEHVKELMKEKKQQKEKEKAVAQEKDETGIFMEREIKYKKRNNGVDISDFL